MNLHKQNFVCWPSVGPQDIKQTYIHTNIHTYIAEIPVLHAVREQISTVPLPDAALTTQGIKH